VFCWLTLGWVYFRIAPDSPAREFGMSVVHGCTACPYNAVLLAVHYAQARMLLRR